MVCGVCGGRVVLVQTPLEVEARPGSSNADSVEWVASYRAGFRHYDDDGQDTGCMFRSEAEGAALVEDQAVNKALARTVAGRMFRDHEVDG